MNKETGTTATAWKVLPWVMGLMVLGVCAAISFWWAKRSHSPKKRVPSRTPYPADDSVCEARHPMMRTTTIRDMIELTTSGSGSGKSFTSLFIIVIRILKALSHTKFYSKRLGSQVSNTMFIWLKK